MQSGLCYLSDLVTSTVLTIPQAPDTLVSLLFLQVLRTLLCTYCLLRLEYSLTERLQGLFPSVLYLNVTIRKDFHSHPQILLFLFYSLYQNMPY